MDSKRGGVINPALCGVDLFAPGKQFTDHLIIGLTRGIDDGLQGYETGQADCGKRYGAQGIEGGGKGGFIPAKLGQGTNL